MTRRRDDQGEFVPAIEQGHECFDAEDFVRLLRWWLESTDEQTLAGDSGFKKGYVKVRIGSVPCALSGDTTRAGVAEVLRVLDADGLVFSVAPTKSGLFKRVAVGAARVLVPGFYLYTDEDQGLPVTLLALDRGTAPADAGAAEGEDIDAFLAEVLREGEVPVLPTFLGEEWEAAVDTVERLLEVFGSTMVVEVTRADGVEVYVQAARDGDGLRVEAVSNTYLAEAGVLGPQQVSAMIEMGWSPPQGEASPNFSRSYAAPLSLRPIAWQLVQTLHDVYAVDVDDVWAVIPASLAEHLDLDEPDDEADNEADDEADQPQPAVDLTALPVGDLLALHTQILAELRDRKVLRTGNSPVGDYAEWLVAHALDGELAPPSQKSFDVKCRPYGLVQVKARLLSDPPKPGELQTGLFKSTGFDYAALVLLNRADYSVARAVLLPSDVVREVWKWTEHQQGWSVFMTPGVMGHERAVDITDLLRAAARQR